MAEQGMRLLEKPLNGELVLRVLRETLKKGE
jgi:hypothetical protein